MKSEARIQAEIMMALGSRKDMRCWRQNVGSAVPLQTLNAWQAKALQLLASGDLVALKRWLLSTPTPVSYGVKGAADLTGILDSGRRLEVEVKAEKGRQSKDQKRYQGMIESMDGIYILARSVEDAEAAL